MSQTVSFIFGSQDTFSTSPTAQSAPKPAQSAPKPAQRAPKPAQRAPKPAQSAPKPAQGPSTSALQAPVAGQQQLEPVLLKVLRWKTKQFSYPVLMQYLGKEDGKVVISDGTYKVPVEVSKNYSAVFKDSFISTYNILTVYGATRAGPKNRQLTLTNVAVSDRSCAGLVGSPKPLPF